MIFFYAKCLNIYVEISDKIELIFKKIYVDLLSRGFFSFILFGRGVLFFGFGFFLRDYWFFVRDDFCENFKNNVLWLIIFRGIKVRDFLKFWGYIDNDFCVFCRRKEIIDYCFLNCFRVK